MKTSLFLALVLALALPHHVRAEAVTGKAAAGRMPASADDAAQRAAYAAAIRAKIAEQWAIGDSVLPGQRCRVAIVQLPGGAVASVKADTDCEFDAAGRAALERAVLRAQPLPYKGFEPVFDRALRIEFSVPR
ncbi:TonB C-terminal domain-containing protein [Stenotrophomonas sp.]|uniref:TonB C-terminal domain-containing protein n=1 Tax=Stenotrophomonas sp. TaxID=69392 RepID=UPI002FCACFBA